MATDRVEFGILHEDGTVTNRRSLKVSSLLSCPYLIMMPDHYREDETCRCNDPNHAEMRDWGYRWEDGRWTAA